MIVCGVLKSFTTFATMSRKNSSRHFGKLEALCSLVDWKPRKFSMANKDCMMVLRVSRGLLSLHLFAKVFLGPPIKGVA